MARIVPTSNRELGVFRIFRSEDYSVERMLIVVQDVDLFVPRIGVWTRRREHVDWSNFYVLVLVIELSDRAQFSHVMLHFFADLNDC